MIVLSTLRIVAAEPEPTFEIMVRAQQEQLAKAIADPVKECGQFEWNYAERGCALVYEPVAGYVWATFPDLTTQFTLAEARKYLSSLSISGQTGWKLVSQEALFPSYQSDYLSNTDILQYRLPSIGAYSKNHFLWTDIYDYGNKYYVISERRFTTQDANSTGSLLAIRPFNDLDRLVADKRKFGDNELLGMVAGYLLREQVALKYEPPQSPAMPLYPPVPEVVKGEFETTQQFIARNNAASIAYEEKKKVIDEAYLKQEEAYRLAVTAAETKYLNDLSRMHDQIGYQQQIAVERAWQLLFGDPVFDTIFYDADAQIFHITLRSARRSFSQQITVPVTIAEAPAYKAKLLDKSLVPVVKLKIDDNEAVTIAGLEIKTNEVRISDDYQFALKENNIPAYRAFIEKNPSAYQVADARIRIAGLQKEYAEKAAALEALAAAERTKIANEQQAEQVKFNQKKSIGDKVCMNQRFLLFFNTKVTGFVEGVFGSRIQVRIADTEHQSVRYHGIELESGMLIWDYFNNWKLYE